MSRPLPPLAAIRCFEAAARLKSFTRAGESLGMTQAAVSYQIKLLEERVGTPLFERGPRGVELTEAGRRLAPRITDAFNQIRTAFDELGTVMDGTLVVDSVVTFATNWLVKRLGRFQLAQPQLAVRLQVSTHFTDFGSEAVDVAIRSGLGGWDGFVEHRLLPASFTPMVSPRFAERLRTPEDLLRIPLVDPEDIWWRQWFEAVGIPFDHRGAGRGMNVATQSLAAQAAMAGHGAAILTPAFFREEKAAGTLVQPFETVHEVGHAYYLVYPESRRSAPKIRAFRDWLLQEVAEDPDSLIPEARR
jgi:LysR family transcriptional regulator, glycine cleavage system transcriptional activator